MSAEQIDHAAEARQLIQSNAVACAVDGAWGAAIAAEAQVHATLALVEQQRIANRIALAAVVAEEQRYYGQHGARVNLIGHEASLYSNPENPDAWNARAPLRDDIREGLGLS